MDGQKLYQMNVLGGLCDDEGLGTFVVTGYAKVIDGRMYIQSGSAFLENDGSWFGTLAEARKASAGKIESIGRKILAQAERFRQG